MGEPALKCNSCTHLTNSLVSACQLVSKRTHSTNSGGALDQIEPGIGRSLLSFLETHLIMRQEMKAFEFELAAQCERHRIAIAGSSTERAAPANAPFPSPSAKGAGANRPDDPPPGKAPASASGAARPDSGAAGAAKAANVKGRAGRAAREARPFWIDLRTIRSMIPEWVTEQVEQFKAEFKHKNQFQMHQNAIQKCREKQLTHSAYFLDRELKYLRVLRIF